LTFSTNISLYFENDTRYEHSYNGKRIGTRMVPFSVTLNGQGHVNVPRWIYQTDTYLGRQWIASKTTHTLLVDVISNDLERPW